MKWERTIAVAAVVFAPLAIAGSALAAGGDLTFAQCVEDGDNNSEGTTCADAPGLDRVEDLAVGEGSLYAAAQNDDAITHYSLGMEGALTFQNCVEADDSNLEGGDCVDNPGLNGVQGVAASASQLYAASGVDDALVHHVLNPPIGAPLFSECIEDEDNDSEGADCSDQPGLNNAEAAAVNGGSLYVVSGTDNALVHFSVDPATGVPSFQGCIEDEDSNSEMADCVDAPGLAGAIDVAVSGGQLYVVSSIDAALVHFSLNSTTGAPSFENCIEDEDLDSELADCTNAPGLNDAASVGVNGTSLYTTSTADDAVDHFGLDPATGAPAFQQCIEDAGDDSEGASCADAPGLLGAEGVVATATSLYAGSNFGVVHFSVDPTTGAPTFQECFEDDDEDSLGASCANVPAMTSTVDVALSGSSLYSASLGNDAIARFSREPDPPPTPPEPQPEPVDAVGPTASITKGPKDKTKKKTATFEFTANEPGATFECSLDGGSFAACSSPDTLKVKKGKHSFQVRATDQGGNVGAPATDDWKVKKKRKK